MFSPAPQWKLKQSTWLFFYHSYIIKSPVITLNHKHSLNSILNKNIWFHEITKASKLTLDLDLSRTWALQQANLLSGGGQHCLSLLQASTLPHWDSADLPFRPTPLHPEEERKVLVLPIRSWDGSRFLCLQIFNADSLFWSFFVVLRR